jgi:integrase
MASRSQSAGNGDASDSTSQHSGPSSPQATLPGLPSLPMRAGHLPMAEVIDLYMAHYAGRDTSRVYRLGWWRDEIGNVELAQMSDDHVHIALERLVQQHSRYYAGEDADGRPILKSKRRPLAPATINRYSASLAAVLSWAIKRRIAPKGFVHPCRSIERKPENNAKTRFLSDEERVRLLEACRGARWPRLYLLVLMALTTGARKGELLALRWLDVDLDRGQAHCGSTKNGDPKVLPLVPTVVALLRDCEGRKPDALLFGSHRNVRRPFAFEPTWLQALKVAKVPNFRFHDLRHSCASLLAREGATLLEIADVLGHRQLAMTKRYSHLTTDHKAALIQRVMGDLT